MESTGESAGIWTPYQSLVWSLLDILLVSLFCILLQSLLNDCIIVQSLRATAGRCKHREELSFHCDPFGRLKSISCWKVVNQCWQTESTWLSLLVLYSPSPTLPSSLASPWSSYHWHHHYQPWTECAHIHLQSVGYRQQILLVRLSPKIQFSIFSAESKIVIVNTVTIRHCKIWWWWAQ
jgi:hypothetical protein